MKQIKVVEYKKKETNMEKVIREHKETQNQRTEALTLLAQDYKIKYDLLVKEGFDKKEALQILIYSVAWK